jgi:hypothetical protein
MGNIWHRIGLGEARSLLLDLLNLLDDASSAWIAADASGAFRKSCWYAAWEASSKEAAGSRMPQTLAISSWMATAPSLS